MAYDYSFGINNTVRGVLVVSGQAVSIDHWIVVIADTTSWLAHASGTLLAIFVAFTDAAQVYGHVTGLEGEGVRIKKIRKNNNISLHDWHCGILCDSYRILLDPHRFWYRRMNGGHGDIGPSRRNYCTIDQQLELNNAHVVTGVYFRAI